MLGLYGCDRCFPNCGIVNLGSELNAPPAVPLGRRLDKPKLSLL